MEALNLAESAIRTKSKTCDTNVSVCSFAFHHFLIIWGRSHYVTENYLFFFYFRKLRNKFN